MKKIKIGLPSFQSMMKSAGKGALNFNMNIKPINLGSSFSTPSIKVKPIKQPTSKDPIGLGGALKTKRTGSPLLANVIVKQPAPVKEGATLNLEQNVRPTAKRVRQAAFDNLNELRAQPSLREGRSGADRFAFGTRRGAQGIPPSSVLQRREFEFFVQQDGVLQRKAFKSRVLAEAQRRKFEGQGDLELLTEVTETRI